MASTENPWNPLAWLDKLRQAVETPEQRWQRLQAEWDALGDPPSEPMALVENPAGPPQPSAIATPQEFARVFLARLNLPVTQRNIENVLTWYNKEGGHWRNSATFNPLNTTLNTPQAVRSINSHGVKAYSSWEAGIDAVVQTFRHPRYDGIRSVLRRQGSCSELSQAIAGSQWGSGPIPCGSSLPEESGPGSSVPGGQTGGPTRAPDELLVDESGCAWRLGIGPVSGCVISRSQARVLKGGAVLVAGAALMLAGTAILAQNIVTTTVGASVLRAAGAAGRAPGRARQAIQGRRDEAEFQRAQAQDAEEGRRARQERARAAFREGRRRRSQESGANRPSRGTRAANRRRRERVGTAPADDF